MSIRFYDEALVEKIRSWTKDSDLTILKPNEVTRLLQEVADKVNDRPIQLPLIALSRDTTVTLDATNKKPLSREGLTFEANQELGKHLAAIPIQIGYQLDIYTRYYEEGDEYLRNFIFNFVNHPNVSIEIPYNNSKISQTTHITLLSSVEDTSDIAQRLIPGQFTRWTLKLILDNAYLFSIPFKKTWKISDSDTDINYKLKQEKTYIKENI